MSEALRERIAEREQRIAALRQEAVILEAEIRAYRDALALSGATSREPISVHKVSRADESKPSGGRSRRGLSAQWQSIWHDVGTRFRDRFSIDDIFSVTQAVDTGINRSNVRSQAWTREQNGDLSRVSDGIYRMTDQGRERFSVQPLPSASPEASLLRLSVEEGVAA